MMNSESGAGICVSLLPEFRINPEDEEWARVWCLQSNVFISW